MKKSLSLEFLSDPMGKVESKVSVIEMEPKQSGSNGSNREQSC